MGGSQSSGRQSFLDKTAAYIDDNGVIIPNGPSIRGTLQALEAFENIQTSDLLFVKKHSLETTDQYIFHWRHVDNADAVENITSGAEDVSIKKQTFKGGDARYLVSFPADDVETFTYVENEDDSSSSDSDSDSDTDEDIFAVQEVNRRARLSDRARERDNYGRYHPASVTPKKEDDTTSTSSAAARTSRKSPIEGIATGGMSRLQRLHQVAQGLTPDEE